jgi:hypothetical protein
MGCRFSSAQLDLSSCVSVQHSAMVETSPPFTMSSVNGNELPLLRDQVGVILIKGPNDQRPLVFVDFELHRSHCKLM